eukprot:jgi/Mesvir1/16270/Mv08514-RA.3
MELSLPPPPHLFPLRERSRRGIRRGAAATCPSGALYPPCAWLRDDQRDGGEPPPTETRRRSSFSCSLCGSSRAIVAPTHRASCSNVSASSSSSSGSPLIAAGAPVEAVLASCPGTPSALGRRDAMSFYYGTSDARLRYHDHDNLWDGPSAALLASRNALGVDGAAPASPSSARARPWQGAFSLAGTRRGDLAVGDFEVDTPRQGVSMFLGGGLFGSGSSGSKGEECQGGAPSGGTGAGAFGSRTPPMHKGIAFHFFNTLVGVVGEGDAATPVDPNSPPGAPQGLPGTGGGGTLDGTVLDLRGRLDGVLSSLSSQLQPLWGGPEPMEVDDSIPSVTARVTVVEATKPAAATKKQALQLRSGAASLPHCDKIAKGGEDAHFIDTPHNAVGVADGVGGWSEYGVDSGLYSRMLMGHARDALGREPPRGVDLKRVLKEAHARTVAAGSSTACLMILTEDQGLQAANLGDSGFMLVRQGQVVFKSPSQQHYFNFPRQLGHGICDPPETADVFQLPVMVGDVIVLGTDGLFDNVYSTEVASLVTKAIKAGLSPGDLAQRIANFAYKRSADRNHMTPFAHEAVSAGYLSYKGGKMDDITVVVSYVTKDRDT